MFLPPFRLSKWRGLLGSWPCGGCEGLEPAAAAAAAAPHEVRSELARDLGASVRADSLCEGAVLLLLRVL